MAGEMECLGDGKQALHQAKDGRPTPVKPWEVAEARDEMQPHPRFPPARGEIVSLTCEMPRRAGRPWSVLVAPRPGQGDFERPREG